MRAIYLREDVFLTSDYHEQNKKDTRIWYVWSNNLDAGTYSVLPYPSIPNDDDNCMFIWDLKTVRHHDVITHGIVRESTNTHSGWELMPWHEYGVEMRWQMEEFCEHNGRDGYYRVVEMPFDDWGKVGT